VLVRTRLWIAGALGLCLAHGAPAADPIRQEPPRLGLPAAQALPLTPVSANRKLADAVADQLRQGGQLRNYTIDITVRDGVVELAGVVADQPQREETLRIVRGVPGVDRVIDRLALAEAIRPVQAEARTQEPPKLPPPEPFMAPPPSPYDMNAPRMPPYAWPTYAPYNNYSRVAYPEAYPYNAWPFIGPIYPFPKVPLGWRSIKLEWDDGYWWYSRTASKYDWWKLRFW